MPPRPRYPLFADEADSPPSPPAPTQAYGVPVTPAPAGPPTPHRRRPWGLWLGLAAVLAVIAGLAVWLATAGGQDGSTQQAGPGGPATSAPGRSAGSSSDLAPAGSVTSQAQVDVPATAPPNQDVQGNPVEYGATNMTDGVPETCWRMPGDGSGRDIRITLATETHLGSVGLINGYAKTATDAQGRKLDWYHGNRRLRAVEWVFDDGTTIRQRLRDTTAVQSLDVDATTTTITLRLLDVSPPGRGPASRNYTAISDLSLVSAGE